MSNECNNLTSLMLRYWNYMYHIRVNMEYANSVARWRYSVYLITSIILEILSIFSVAGWLINSNLAWVSATVIFLSQSLTIVNRYFNYDKKVIFLDIYIDSLKYVFLDMEKNWYAVRGGFYSDADIDELLSKYKLDVCNAEVRFLTRGTLRHNEKYFLKAEKNAEEYLNLYGKDL